MSQSCNVVFQNTDVMEIVKAMRREYGGTNYEIHLTDGDDHFIVHFRQELPVEVKAENAKLMIHKRVAGKHRKMHVFTDGNCAGDYAEVFSRDPGALLSLGAYGHAPEIMACLASHFGGGWIKNEAVGDAWQYVKPAEVVA